jgi:hypothetical protein
MRTVGLCATHWKAPERHRFLWTTTLEERQLIVWRETMKLTAVGRALSLRAVR